MGALPVACSFCSQGNGHHEHFAGIVTAAAHLHQIGVGSEIAGAHLGAGLKAAAAKNHGLTEQVVLAVRIRNPHAVDAPVVAVQLANAGFIADLNAHGGCDLTPLHKLPETAADATGWMNDYTWL